MSDNRHFSKTANYPHLVASIKAEHLVASIKAELPLDGSLPPHWGSHHTHWAYIAAETIQTEGGEGHEARIVFSLEKRWSARRHLTPYRVGVNQSSSVTEVLEKLHALIVKWERLRPVDGRPLGESEKFIRAELSRRMSIDPSDLEMRLHSQAPLSDALEVRVLPRLAPRQSTHISAASYCVMHTYTHRGVGTIIDELCGQMEYIYGLTDHFKSRPDEVTHDFVNRGVQPGDVLITSCGLKHTITADDLALHDTWSDTVQTLGGYSNILSNAIMSKTTWTSKKDPAPATDPYLKDPYGDLKGRLYSRLKLVVAEVNQMIAQVERLLLKQGLIRHDANPIDYPVWRAPSPERARTMSVEALEKELLAVSGEFTARTLQLRELEKTANSTKKGHR